MNFECKGVCVWSVIIHGVGKERRPAHIDAYANARGDTYLKPQHRMPNPDNQWSFGKVPTEVGHCVIVNQIKRAFVSSLVVPFG
jgi:hypothetical protein